MNYRKMLLAAATQLAVLIATAQISVGVFLPFKQKGALADRSVEYYRGLLMAIDSLSHDGTSFKVTAADCGTTAADMKALLDETKNGVFDIVFCSSNQEQLSVVNEYSIKNGTKFTMPFGGRYDEWVSNPNFYALKVTQTDYTPKAYKLLSDAFRNKTFYVVFAGKNKEICPFAKYLTKYVKGVKTLSLADKEKKVAEAVADEKAVIVAAMYDTQTQNTLLNFIQQIPNRQAALVGYSSWYEKAQGTDEVKALSNCNTYLILNNFQRQNLPRTKKFLTQYEDNFNIKPVNELFSFPMWGFDTGYYLLKGLTRHKKDFYDQPLYSAPLQSALRFEPRASKQGLINTSCLLLHFKLDNTQELIEIKE